MQNLSQNKHTSKESHKKNLGTKLNKTLKTKKKLYKKEREREDWLHLLSVLVFLLLLFNLV
jgi:hypothetical protein